jgi:hypothetical protein
MLPGRSPPPAGILKAGKKERDPMSTKHYATGITANPAALGQGLYDMMRAHPDGACLRFGMLVAGIMESFDRNLAEKIPDGELTHLPSHSDVGDGKAVRAKITHDVTVEVLRIATADGWCIA